VANSGDDVMEDLRVSSTTESLIRKVTEGALREKGESFVFNGGGSSYVGSWGT